MKLFNEQATFAFRANFSSMFIKCSLNFRFVIIFNLD